MTVYTRLHVLVVEDNEDDARFISRVGLENPLVETLRVLSSSEEARDYLLGKEPFGNRAAFPLPSLLLLDLKLRGMSGLNLLRWIRQTPEHRLTSVVVLSGSASASDLNRAYELGVDGYIVKPVDLRDLATTLAGVLAMRAESGSPLAHPL